MISEAMQKLTNTTALTKCLCILPTLILSAHSQIINVDYKTILNDLEYYCSVSGKQIPIWNGKKMLEIRNGFLKNNPHQICKLCLDFEKINY